MTEGGLHYRMSLKLYFEEKAFGPGMLELLRNVEATGSLQKAARAMNMAYSKAWKIVKESERAWGFCLTERETGGRDGGGSTLTPQARLLMETYERFLKEADQELDRLFGVYFSPQWEQRLKQSLQEET